MLNKLILSTIFLFIFISCGSDNDITPTSNGPAQNEDIDQFVNQLISSDNAKEDDSAAFYKLHWYESNSGEWCLYYYTLISSVSNLDRINNTVTIFSSKVDLTDSRTNHQSCPSTPPNIQMNRVTKFTMPEVDKSIKESIERFLNPNTLCSKNSSWTNCLVTARFDTSYKGLEARYVEAVLQNKNGNTYIQKAWIAKRSLLHNVFEYDIYNKETKGRRRFKTYLD